jgi:hypothetical protein
MADKVVVVATAVSVISRNRTCMVHDLLLSHCTVH